MVIAWEDTSDGMQSVWTAASTMLLSREWDEKVDKDNGAADCRAEHLRSCWCRHAA